MRTSRSDRIVGTGGADRLVGKGGIVTRAVADTRIRRMVVAFIAAL